VKGDVLHSDGTMEEAPASEDAEALLLDLEIWLQGSIDIADRLYSLSPSIPLMRTMTKLEEAQMWLERGERR
jgi:predicted ATPase